MFPGYRNLHHQGLLAQRAAKALTRLGSCRLCPQSCGVNRKASETGVCSTGRHAMVANAMLHFGEEIPLVGEKGSGTIFFCGCNIGCVFCQNSSISRTTQGCQETPAEDLASIMLDLAAQGAHNINLVTPSHVVPQILEAVNIAASQGLNIPLVYNSGGYDSVETLALLDGVVDIYMPDLKFYDQNVSARLCQAPDYPAVARATVKEMQRQVGDLIITDGIATKGLLVRHLVLPSGLAGTAEWMRFLVSEVSPHVYVNLMDQYYPCAEAEYHPDINRPLHPEEFTLAQEHAERAGISRLHEADAAMLARLIRLFSSSRSKER
ncbi:radical SAM protein [Desulfovibrio inopinatus]|uniref:radical SAM protein n=1 Tax=Desulfovibrio inopinatus TaxID=102109 RepID=UPI000419FE35|nr:radical SAM protein [Desulfovibrio inopinatus]